MMKLRSQVKACFVHIEEKTRINWIVNLSLEILYFYSYVLIICNKS